MEEYLARSKNSIKEELFWNITQFRTQTQLILIFEKRKQKQQKQLLFLIRQNYYLLLERKFFERVELCSSRSNPFPPPFLPPFFDYGASSCNSLFFIERFQLFQHFCRDAVEEAAKEMRTISRSTIFSNPIRIDGNEESRDEDTHTRRRDGRIKG